MMGSYEAPQELRDLAYRYAWAVDRRDAAAIIPLFTAEGAVRGFGTNPIDYTGPQRLSEMMADLGMFEKTMHNVFNQLFERGADGEVTGLTYCIASHMLPGDEPMLIDMAIWYHNRYAQEDGVWKFTERRLEVLWTENRPAKHFAPGIMSKLEDVFK
jgi:SnoaL-like domain